MPEQRWRPWPHANCPACGGDLEVYTTSDTDGWVYDGDPLRCTDCGRDDGYMSVAAEDDVSACWEGV